MKGTSIDDRALVGARAQLGTGVSVGPFAVIEDGAVVGDGCRVLAGAHIGSATTLGRDNVVHMNAVVGNEPQDMGYEGFPSQVVIGDGNVFREGCTVNRGSRPESVTRIGDGCFLMANTHVAHDCVVEDGVIFANGALLGGHARVGAGAFLSGNVVVHQHVRIGRLCMLQGLAAVSQDVPPFCIAATGLNTLRGVNVVGLRRAGLDRERISAIRRAYRDLFFGRPNLRRARMALRESALDEGAMTSELKELLAFIESSKRGVCSAAPGRGMLGTGADLAHD